ncbi:MAG: UDP-3-O-acyl-N-acetylglucosamine deacetylase [Spirochaetia bacterium]|nr:UDP-3-O-acyl-N-acetylglucosamine deacetylase [Spirochaetota bacterium]MCX8097177.1 UDP-3-O-acyl-N-acetylglucosamine deacetylase [Spirochaetota bacterium]MDW8112650.1 UDP-3-O-acyl-N-acetylglucosamine deacetylase [Spirochaetia bacterium]
MDYQKTLSRPVFFEGIGLHTGEYSAIELLPAEENSGILFQVEDKTFECSIKSVCDTLHNISLCFGDYKIMTVEHLLASLFGLGIDNVIVRIVRGSEIPILDGSSKVFVERMLEAGIVKQKDKKNYFYPDIEFYFHKNEDQYIKFKPNDRLVIDYEIEFDVIGREHMRIEINEDSFLREICNARTFGFIEDAEILRKSGLALGAGLDNVHVYSRTERRSLNESRYSNESVRHKVLDLLGAIALFYPRIVGEFIARKSGHFVDCKLISMIYDEYM